MRWQTIPVEAYGIIYCPERSEQGTVFNEHRVSVHGPACLSRCVVTIWKRIMSKLLGLIPPSVTYNERSDLFEVIANQCPYF